MSHKTETFIKVGAVLLILFFIILYPFLFPSSYHRGIMIIIGLKAIVAIGLCLLMGFAGQISLGHAAFFGLGAYVTAILSVRTGLPPFFAMILAAVVTALVAYVVGIPTLKLKGHYLALSTLGFGIIIYMLIMENYRLTGGPSGLTGIPNLNIFGFTFRSSLSYYVLVWTLLFIIVIITHNIIHSRIGRALRSLHGSELAAETLGVNTAAFKVQVFVLSAVYASLAGSIYAFYMNFLSPSTFNFFASVEFILIGVLGGIASIWGPLFGSGLLMFLREFLRTNIPLLIPGAGGEVEIVVYGFILVIIMIFMPEGLISGITRRLEGMFQNKVEDITLSKIKEEAQDGPVTGS